MIENNESIFQIIGRLKIATNGNARAQELIDILDKKIKRLPLDGQFERILLFKEQTNNLNETSKDVLTKGVSSK